MSEPVRRSLLFIVSSDPRQTARPAEAIRVAAGLGAWKKLDITVYLRDAAVLALGEWVDELRDEDNYTRYLPMLAEAGKPIYVQAGAAERVGLEAASHRYIPITDAELATLAAQSFAVLRF